MFADIEAIETELCRPLGEAEAKRAGLLLEDALALIRGRIPDVINRCAADPGFAQRVGMVQRKAVTRVLRNPDGVRDESEGTYRVGALDQRVASGTMQITPSDWKDLGLDRGTGHLSFDAWRFRRKDGSCP